MDEGVREQIEVALARTERLRQAEPARMESHRDAADAAHDQAHSVVE